MESALFDEIDRLQLKLQAECSDRDRRLADLARTHARITDLTAQLNNALGRAKETA